MSQQNGTHATYENGTPEDKLANFVMREFCVSVSNGLLKTKGISVSEQEIYSFLCAKLPKGVNSSAPSTPLGTTNPPFLSNGTAKKATATQKPRCEGFKSKGDQKGEPCGKLAVPGSNFCATHGKNEKSPAKTTPPKPSGGKFELVDEDPIGTPKQKIMRTKFNGVEYCYNPDHCYLLKISEDLDQAIVSGIYTPNKEMKNMPSFDDSGILIQRKLTPTEANNARYVGFIVLDSAIDRSTTANNATMSVQNTMVENKTTVDTQSGVDKGSSTEKGNSGIVGGDSVINSFLDNMKREVANA